MFCESPLNRLLWSYYGDGHAGIAIRFNTTLDARSLLGREVLVLPVTYRTTYPEFNYFTTSWFERIEILVATKSIEWQHERESRV